MPLYEYHCYSCDEPFEQLIRNGEQPECPQCHTTMVDQLMSAPASPATGRNSLPIAGSCPPPMAPPCGPGCRRVPG